MAKKKKSASMNDNLSDSAPLCAIRGFDFPLGEALELVKRKGGRSRLNDEERANLRLHRIEAGTVFDRSDYPRELVDIWCENWYCAPTTVSSIDDVPEQFRHLYAERADHFVLKEFF